MAGELLNALRRINKKIEDASFVAIAQTGDFIEDEFKEMVNREVYSAYSPKQGGYDRTGALGDSPTITSLSRSGVTVKFADSGDWYSLAGENKGNLFYALYGLEGGYTWGRQPSNIMREVTSPRFHYEISGEFADSMRALGIPIFRK